MKIYHFNYRTINIHCHPIVFIDKISIIERLKIYQEVNFKNKGSKFFKEEIES